MNSEMKNSEQSNKEKLEREPALRFPEFRGTANWKKKELNKLLTIGNGKDYKHLSTGDIPVYGSGGYMLSVNDYLYDGESVCIGRKGTIDKPVFLSGKFWTVDTLFYTHSFIKCSPKFIFYQFQKINWKNYNEAGGIPSLTKTTIGRIEILVPSFTEQQKIADCLSSLDNVISLQKQKIDALQQYKKGLMQKLFPAEGKSMPDLRLPEFLQQEEWEQRQLGEIAKFSSGGTPSKDIADYWNGAIPWISASSMYSTKLNKSNSNVTNLAIGNGTRIAKKGSLLILVRGSMLFNRIPMGIADIDVAFNQDVKSLSVDKKNNAMFLLYQLMAFESRIAINETGIGAGKIETEDLKRLNIYLPSISEQQQIADCLSSFEELIDAETQKLSALKKHKAGLMQQLFPIMGEINR